MKKNNGFTLLELLIVVGILLLLMGIAAPMLYKYVERTHKTADVQSAKAIAEEFSVEFYSNPELHDEVLDAAAGNSKNNINIIAYCDAGSDTWTVSGNSEDLKNFVNESIYSRPIKYKKAIDPSYNVLPEEDELGMRMYALGSWDEFTPKGWAIAVVDDKPVVYLTDGGRLTQGVSPLVCPDYPGAIGER
jgi:prepilin-type N-terminal cleavage/methylation domain-containing protein